MASDYKQINGALYGLFEKTNGDYVKYKGRWYKAKFIKPGSAGGGITSHNVKSKNVYNLYPISKTTKVGDYVITNTGKSYPITEMDLSSSSAYNSRFTGNSDKLHYKVNLGHYVETPDGRILEPGDDYYIRKNTNYNSYNLRSKPLEVVDSPETIKKRAYRRLGLSENYSTNTTTGNTTATTSTANATRNLNSNIASTNSRSNRATRSTNGLISRASSVPTVNSNRNTNRRGTQNAIVLSTGQASTPSFGLYIIKSGDTLSKIAANNNMTIDLILALNSDIKDPNKIYAGRSLNLSNGPISLDLYNSLAYTPTQLGIGSQAIEDTLDLNSNNFLDNVTLNYLNNNFLTSVSPSTILNNKVDIGSSISNYLLPYANLDMNKLLSGINYSALSAGLKTPDLVASEKVIPSIEVNPRDYYKNKFDYVDSVPTYDFENTGYKFDINKLLEATKKYF